MNVCSRGLYWDFRVSTFCSHVAMSQTASDEEMNEGYDQWIASTMYATDDELIAWADLMRLQGKLSGGGATG